MADVFISYAQAHRGETKSLASVIDQRGHTVWWDTSLLPHERFTEAILRELDLVDGI